MNNEGYSTEGARATFGSIAKLKMLQTSSAALHLDTKAEWLESQYDIDMATEVYNDILSLEGKSDRTRDEGLRVLTHVTIDAKQTLGVFSDSDIVSMAKSQSDISTKAKAFGVLEKPNDNLDFVAEIYEDLGEQIQRPDGADLKAVSHMTASLYGQSVDHPQLAAWAHSFGEMATQQSFVQAEPHYLTKLALGCNKNFLIPATDATIMTRSAIHALDLLSHENGWKNNATRDKDMATESLSTVMVNAGSLMQLRELASRDTDESVDSTMLTQLMKQASVSCFDMRLTSYLNNMSQTVPANKIKELHVDLVRNAENFNTIPTQKALLEMLDRQDDTDVYDKRLLEATIQEAERRYEQIKSYNVDKTLLEVTGAHIMFTAKNDTVEDKHIVLAAVSNEQSLQTVMDVAIADSDAIDEDYDITIECYDDTTPFLREIISDQVEKSILGKPNDLDRLITQPVPKVAKRLDSRSHIQHRLEFEAAILNQNNTTEKVLRTHILSNDDQLEQTNVNETAAKLRISKKDDDTIRVYDLTDYSSFDEAIIKIHRENPEYSDKTHNTELQMGDANDFLKQTLKDDVKSYTTKPTAEGMKNLNQHWTRTTSQLVDSRVKDPDSRSNIKEAIKNNTRIQPTATINKVRSP